MRTGYRRPWKHPLGAGAPVPLEGDMSLDASHQESRSGHVTENLRPNRFMG
jgi:hypothetical protein